MESKKLKLTYIAIKLPGKRAILHAKSLNKLDILLDYHCFLNIYMCNITGKICKFEDYPHLQYLRNSKNDSDSFMQFSNDVFRRQLFTLDDIGKFKTCYDKTVIICQRKDREEYFKLMQDFIKTHIETIANEGK